MELNKLKELCEDQYFETVENKYIQVYIFYILQGNCEKYKKTTVELKKGTLMRETLTEEIVKHRNEGGRRYHVTGIYSFRFDETDLLKFAELSSSYLHTHKQIENIPFDPSPELFQHHNSMFVLMGCEQSRKTKRTDIPVRRMTLKNH
jgi:hypothetical protein